MEPDQVRTMVALAQAGRAEGYEALLEAFGPRLFAYFLRATGRYHDAEDLLGEMSLRLVKNLSSYVDQGRFEPWLFRIAANMVRDRIRRRTASPPPISLLGKDDEGRSPADRIAGKDRPIDAAMRVAEDAQRVHAALAKLDETTRQMILLRHFGEMSFKEIAEIFECPLGTALARVHRGLARLRKLMDSEDEPE